MLSLDRLLTFLIILALVGAVVALGYVITHPVEEDFTEFYILGPDGKAEGYPSELEVGGEGTVILGITNREHEPMTYKVEMTVEGVHEKTIGPLTLEHEETWEEEVGFTPNEVSARTVLAETVDPGTGIYAQQITSIEVESTEHLKPGDYIWILGSYWKEDEQRQITSMENNKISFASSLVYYHGTGKVV